MPFFTELRAQARVSVDRRRYGHKGIHGCLRETVLPGVRGGHRAEQEGEAAELLLGQVQVGIRQEARAQKEEGGIAE